MKTSYEKFMASNAVQPVKVELALADDVKKGVLTYFNTTTTGVSKAIGAISALREALAVHEKALNEGKNFQSLKAKIEQSAKDLGVSPNQWEIYVDVNDAIADIKTTENKANALKKAIANLTQ